MSVLEEIAISGNLAEQPEPLVEAGRVNLSLVHGGLVEVIPVEEEQTGSELDRKNAAFLDKLGVKIDTSPHSPIARISLGEGQEALACAWLYSLKARVLQDFPGRVGGNFRDIFEVTDLFLLAKESRGEAAFMLSDDRMALSYDYPARAVFIENIIEDSEHNGLDGAPEHVVNAVLTSFDLEAETLKFKKPFANERARHTKYHLTHIPWGSHSRRESTEKAKSWLDLTGD